MSAYKTIRNVAILDEHNLTDDSDEVVIEVDARRLQLIADNNNRRIKETGDETPVVIGHTRDELPENEQPEIVGYARDFKVKRLYNSNRRAIFCTFRILKNKLQRLSDFPRRSVELWLKKWVIDPISLLGATTPDRDLGLLKFASGDHSYVHVLPGDNMPNDKNVEMAATVVAMLQETAAWKFLESLMNQTQGQPAQQAPQPQAAEEDEMMPKDEDLDVIDEGDEDIDDEEDVDLEDEDLDDDDEGMEDDEDVELDDDDEDDEPKQKYSASAPSATNTYVPGGQKVKKKKKASAIPKVEKVKMQRDQKQNQLVRLERKYDKLAQSHNALKVKLSRTERKSALKQLELEGFDFDMTEELEEAVTKDAAGFKKQVQRIRKRYSRSPGFDGDLQSLSRTDAPNQTKLGQEAIVKLATETGISYAEAKARLDK